MLELFDLDLRLLRLGSGNLILLPLSAPVLQTGLAHLLEPQRPGAYLLVLLFARPGLSVYPTRPSG